MNANPNHARAIFLAAVENHAPDQWQAYLDVACGDADLRQRVEVLLHAHQQANSLLDAPPAVPAATIALPSREGPGTHIGPYKLMEQVGEGGMGLVFVAEQQHPVRRKVAVKIVKPGMDTRQVIARFEAERQALALMDHVNIARVLDAGATETGRPYFVMELVKGVPITQFCDDNRLNPRQRLELFGDVCNAVQHAHQKGIIHRDIKPSNVLVTSHDGKPVVKVIDFGVAKAIGQQLTDKTVHTQLSQLLGTPLYMSPEQAGQSGLDVDTRTDIYALGVLLYELLTGATPFDQERFRAAGYEEMRRIIREEEPPKPSTRISTLGQAATTVSAQRQSDPKRLSRLFRGELDWIVMKALDKDRNRRYETANGFAMDVQRYLADEPVQACPPSLGYRLRKLARRNKKGLAAAGLFLFFIVLLGGVVGWSVRDRSARQAEAAQQARESLNRARQFIREDKLDLARRELAEAKGRIGDDHAALRYLAEEVEALETELDRFERFFALVDKAHEAEISQAVELVLADVMSEAMKSPPRPALWRTRVPARAVPFLLQALARYEVLERADWNSALEQSLLEPEQVARIKRTVYEELLWLADDVIGRNQDHRSGTKLPAQDAALRGLHYLGKAALAHRPTAVLYRIRGYCRKRLGDEQAARADQALARETPATLAVDHFLLGRATFDSGNKPEAKRYFEAALRVEPTHYWSLSALGRCHLNDKDYPAAIAAFTGCIMKRPDHAEVYFLRSTAWQGLRKHDKAPDRYHEALADVNKAIELDPTVASSWFGRGLVYGHLGEHERALADFNKGVALAPEYVEGWYYRGLAFNHLAEHRKAIGDFTRCIELDPKYTAAWYERGQRYAKLNEPAKAIADCSKAIEQDPKYVPAWFERGNAYASLNEPAKALADYSKAIELDPKYMAAWNNRGNVYKRLGELAKALADYSKAIDLDPKHAWAWYNRGNAYAILKQPDKAIADLTRAIDLDLKLAFAWNNRGWEFKKLGQLDKALADFTRAIELDPKIAEAWMNRGRVYKELKQPDNAMADFSKVLDLGLIKGATHWYSLGNEFRDLQRWDEAVRAFREAIGLDPGFAEAHCHLGSVLLQQGLFAQALAFMKKGHDLGSARKSWRNPSALWVKEFERWLELDGKLPAALQGALLLSTAEQQEFAYLCMLKRWYAAAAGFCEKAYAQHKGDTTRVRGIRAAVLAGCGKGDDAAKLDDKERTRWRQQALDWLKADLAIWKKQLQSKAPKTQLSARQSLRIYLDNPDLAGVRDGHALKQLPDTERQAWQKLWAEVALLLKNDSKPP